jgi:hypothetical protein
MSDVFSPGGGGGRAPLLSAEEENGLPGIDIGWPLSADGLQQIVNQINLLSRYAIVDINTQRLLGRYGVGKGRAQQITLGNGIGLTDAGVLSATSGSSGSTPSTTTGTATFNIATTNPTHAQMIALATTPFTLIPAPAADQIIIVLKAMFFGRQTSPAAGAIAASMRYIGTTIPTTSLGGVSNGARTLIDVIADPIQPSTSASPDTYKGAGIELFSTLGPTSSGAGTYQYTLWYLLVTQGV